MSNPYLEGNFGPVTEEVTVIDLRVTGTIPEELTAGTCATDRTRSRRPIPTRTTGSPATAWSTACDSTTVGRSGTATAGSAAARSASASARSAARRARASATWTSAPNTNVIGHAGRPSPSSRPGAARRARRRARHRSARRDFDGTLDAGYTAHPKRDPETGELHAMSYCWGRGNQVAVHRRRHRRPGAKRDESRCPAARWSTTCRSPSATRSSTTCRSPSTWRRRWAARDPLLLGRRLPRPRRPARRTRRSTAPCAGSTSTPATCSTR